MWCSVSMQAFKFGSRQCCRPLERLEVQECGELITRSKGKNNLQQRVTCEFRDFMDVMSLLSLLNLCMIQLVGDLVFSSFFSL